MFSDMIRKVLCAFGTGIRCAPGDNGMILNKAFHYTSTFEYIFLCYIPTRFHSMYIDRVALDPGIGTIPRAGFGLAWLT